MKLRNYNIIMIFSVHMVGGGVCVCVCVCGGGGGGGAQAKSVGEA